MCFVATPAALSSLPTVSVSLLFHLKTSLCFEIISNYLGIVTSWLEMQSIYSDIAIIQLVPWCKHYHLAHGDDKAGYECERHYRDNRPYVRISTQAPNGNGTFHWCHLLSPLHYEMILTPFFSGLPNFKGREPTSFAPISTLLLTYDIPVIMLMKVE